MDTTFHTQHRVPTGRLWHGLNTIILRRPSVCIRCYHARPFPHSHATAGRRTLPPSRQIPRPRNAPLPYPRGRDRVSPISCYLRLHLSLHILTDLPAQLQCSGKAHEIQLGRACRVAPAVDDNRCPSPMDDMERYGEVRDGFQGKGVGLHGRDRTGAGVRGGLLYLGSLDHGSACGCDGVGDVGARY